MSACNHLTDAGACCAFCGRPLPVINGQLLPWRAANGLFYCPACCAVAAVEASFQSRGRTAKPAIQPHGARARTNRQE